MNLLASIPNTTPPLSNRNQLLRHAIGKLAVSSLIRSVDDPADGGPPALSLHQRDGDLHGGTTSGNTLLVPDLEQGSHGVHDQVKVEDWVEWELWGRGAREKGTS